MTDLELILTSLGETETALSQVPILLKQFRQKVLFMAVSGELTRDWKEGNTEGVAKWEKKKIEEISKHALGKMLDKAKNVGELTPYLKNINVRWFEFDLDDISDLDSN